MDETTVAIIERLAEKLGVTAEYLWGVLVTQAPISAATNAVILCVLWFAVWRGWKFVLGMERGFTSPRDFAMAGMVVVSAFVVMATLVISEGIVYGLVNPEYWALKQILK